MCETRNNLTEVHRLPYLGKVAVILLKTVAAILIIALNCFLMVWTGAQLLTVVGDPMIAVLPILGFGSLAFFLLQYFILGKPTSH